MWQRRGVATKPDSRWDQGRVLPRDGTSVRNSPHPGQIRSHLSFLTHDPPTAPGRVRLMGPTRRERRHLSATNAGAARRLPYSPNTRSYLQFQVRNPALMKMPTSFHSSQRAAIRRLLLENRTIQLQTNPVGRWKWLERSNKGVGIQPIRIDRYPSTHHTISDEASKILARGGPTQPLSVCYGKTPPVPAIGSCIPDKVGLSTYSMDMMRLCSRSLALDARLLNVLERF